MRHKRFHRTLLFTFMMGILAFLLFRSPVKAAPPALPRTPIIPTIVFTPPPPTATPTRLPLPPVPPPELKDPPTAPTNLRIEAEEEDLIVVSWDDNSANEQGFKVYYRQPSADTWQIQESESAYRIFIGNLSADTEYCFQATAYNEDGESPPSNQDCGLTDLAPPSHFRAYNVTSTSVTLTWADNANRETSYDLVRVRIPGGNYHRIEFEPQEGGAFTYTDSGLEPDTEYQYYVSVARAPDGDDPYGDNWARTSL